MSRNCYTYLIGWSNLNTWYYGVRYARGCSPSDLWTTYFTSSTFVKNQRKLYGEPDVISVRKQFGEDSYNAKLWEDRVLARLGVIKDCKWLNQSNNHSFRGVSSPWNLGLTKETCPSILLASRKISQKRSGSKATQKTKQILSTAQQKVKRENSWRQLIKDPRYSKFKSYDDFKFQVITVCDSCWCIPLVITRKLDVTEKGVKTVLKNAGIKFIKDSRISKVYSNYGHKFESFDEYVNQILSLHHSGKTPFQISKILEINDFGVCTVLARNNIISNKTKPGPKNGQLFGTRQNFPAKWFNNGTVARRFDNPPDSSWSLGRRLMRKQILV